MSRTKRDEMIVVAMDAVEQQIECGKASDVFLMAGCVVDELLKHYKFKPRTSTDKEPDGNHDPQRDAD